MKPRASIVIPLLREPLAWLEQCVQSALQQTVPCEVLVVISPRTPGELLAALAEWSTTATALRVIPEVNNGFAAALNTGIHASKTDRIGFLLADDWLERVAVATCLAHDADIISTGLRVWNEGGLSRFTFLDRRPTQALYETLPTIGRRAAFLEHFFLFRREALVAVGGVDETIGLTGADDFDLIWSLLEKGATVRVLPDQLYNYRDHSRERLTLRSPDLQRRDLTRVLEKHGVQGEALEEMLRDHGMWFGAPVHVIAERLTAAKRRAPT